MDRMTDLYQGAVMEMAAVFRRLNDADVDRACSMIADARTVVVFGGGRERLQIMGFAMRLYHMGRSVAVEGDMTTPPVGKGDLFIVTVGPGEISRRSW
jgi:6-phospho-3-hexuloisomerase